MERYTGNLAAEKELVEKVLTGDRYAFGIIIKNTERLVAMIVFKMVPGATDRKDLVQEIYLRAFDKLNSFQFKSKLSTWIGQIAYYTCLHYLEKKKVLLVDHADAGEDCEVSLLEQLNDKSVSSFSKEGETLLIRKELKHILQTAIDQLPPIYRTLLSLYQEGLTNMEMVQITGLPEGTIKSYLFRARKTLKENLLSNYQKEDL